MPIQPSVLSIRKYSGKTDSRTPPQFLREFIMSTLYTSDDTSNIRNFLASLGNQFSIYAPAFPYTGTFDDVKRYFLLLTWNHNDMAKELKVIKDEEFDLSGPESWDKYLIQTYIRLQDCQADDIDFQKMMISKVFEVKKMDLAVGNFVVEEQVKGSNYGTRQRVRSKDLEWFGQMVYYEQSKSESQD